MKISEFHLNPKAEQEGVWFDVGKGLRLKIARISSPAFENWVRTNTRLAQTRKLITQDNAPDAEMIPGIARHILRDWENLTDDNDQPVPYSVQKAEEYLTKYKEFLKMVLLYATEYDGFRASQAAEDAKN